MEPITVGKLSFERKMEADNEETVTVCKATDKEVYATYTKCNDDQREWNYLKKNNWPANGVGANPPSGRWVLLEYLGKDRSSANLEPERHDNGFSVKELMRLTVTVNAIFGEDDEPVLEIEAASQPKKRRRAKKP